MNVRDVVGLDVDGAHAFDHVGGHVVTPLRVLASVVPCARLTNLRSPRTARYPPAESSWLASISEPNTCGYTKYR